MNTEEISGEIFECKTYPKGIFYLLNIFALLKVATEAMIEISKISLSEAYNNVIHPFGDERVRANSLFRIPAPLWIFISLALIFALDRFELGIFAGFCICFLLDNLMSDKFIGKITTYLPSDIKILSLIIQPEVVESQVFKNNLFTVWRVVLLYASKSHQDELASGNIEASIFYESRDLRLAYRKAVTLSKAYGVPIDFQDSNGDAPEIYLKHHDLKEHNSLRRRIGKDIRPNDIAQCKDLIVVNNKAVPYSIGSYWNLESYIQAASEMCSILVKSFVLVVLINFLSFAGELVWGLAGSSPRQSMQQSFQGASSLLDYSNFIFDNFVDIFEMLIISGFLLSKSLNVSMSEIFRITPKKLDYSLRFRLWGDERLQSSVAVKEIENMLYIKSPYPMIIIADSWNVIEITGLQTIAEFKVLLLRLAEGVSSMRDRIGQFKS